MVDIYIDFNEPALALQQSRPRRRLGRQSDADVQRHDIRAVRDEDRVRQPGRRDGRRLLERPGGPAHALRDHRGHAPVRRLAADIPARSATDQGMAANGIQR
jgi:hypothetical protein